jgi:hypothetical protein
MLLLSEELRLRPGTEGLDSVLRRDALPSPERAASERRHPLATEVAPAPHPGGPSARPGCTTRSRNPSSSTESFTRRRAEISRVPLSVAARSTASAMWLLVSDQERNFPTRPILHQVDFGVRGGSRNPITEEYALKDVTTTTVPPGESPPRDAIGKSVFWKLHPELEPACRIRSASRHSRLKPKHAPGRTRRRALNWPYGRSCYHCHFVDDHKMLLEIWCAHRGCGMHRGHQRVRSH